MIQTTLPRARARGFTLVELMVVVVIVGVLATIGIAMFRRQSYGSKTTEAMAMIQSIRAAEERWRSENLRYLNVSPDGLTFYPPAPVHGHKRSFYQSGNCAPSPTPSEDCLWKLLSPAVPGPVEFQYNVTAGAPDVAMTTPQMGGVSFGVAADHWYVIQARADTDGDGRYARFVASSLNGDVGSENEGD